MKKVKLTIYRSISIVYTKARYRIRYLSNKQKSSMTLCLNYSLWVPCSNPSVRNNLKLTICLSQFQE